MSASDAAATLCVAGQYCDGYTAIAHPVNALFSDATLVLISPDIHRTAHLSEVRVSEDLGRLPRTFTFADGATLVVPTSDELSKKLGESKPKLQRWESKYRYVVAALAAIIGTAWWIYSCAIPYIADQAVARFGTKLESAHPGSTLAKLDAAGVWKPSKLDENRQAKARRVIAARLRPGHVDLKRIAFRDSPDLGANALALEGGDIVLTDDLIHILSPEEQIAAVAHELGHVYHHHNQRLWLRQVGLLGAMRLLLGTSGWHDPIADTTQLLGETRYSREFEADADAYAVGLLTESGISPCHLATALRKLEVATPIHVKTQSEWFSSHPLMEDRIGKIEDSCNARD
jgi:Zn-dependent protease with chaperone function